MTLVRSELTSPNAPTTNSRMLPRDCSLATHGPISPGLVPFKAVSMLASLRRYSAGSALALLLACLSLLAAVARGYLLGPALIT